MAAGSKEEGEEEGDAFAGDMSQRLAAHHTNSS